MSLSNCPKCRGRKVVPDSKVLNVVIEKGMRNKQTIVFERESEQSPDYIPGDVIFTLRLLKHKRFKRIGDNLYTTQKINLRNSIMGFSKRLQHLDGHYLEFTEKGVVQPFQVQMIEDEGMPKHQFPSEAGKLHLKFIVNLPDEISAEG